MTKPRNRFSYIMWAIFAALLSVLFYKSTLEFLDSIDLLDSTYNIVIVILLGLVIIELVILFDNLIKKGQHSTGDKKYKMYGIVGFFIALSGFLGVRIATAKTLLNLINESNTLESLYTKSQINETGKVFFSLNSVNDIYDSVLSICFKIFGNTAVGVMMAQMLIILAIFLLAYYGIKALYGRMEAFIAGIGIAFLPAFSIYTDNYASFLIRLLMFTLGIYTISVAKRMMKYRYGLETGIIIASVISGLLYAYSDTCIGLIALLIVFIIENNELSVGRRIADVVISVLSCACAVITPMLLTVLNDKNIASMGYGIFKILNKRFSGTFKYTAIFDYARSNFILIVIIACISYIVMFLRCKFDEAHSMILLFIITVVAMSYFNRDTLLDYSLSCTLCLLVIAGAGIKKLVVHPVTIQDNDDDDDEIDIRRFDEQDPDIEILDEGNDVAKEEQNAESESDVPKEEPVEEPSGIPVVEPESEPETVPESEPEAIPDSEPEEKPANKPESESVKENNTDIILFKNPLPLPKKGVKREVKYDYDVPDELMHYDVELTDTNYFYDVV